MLKYLKSIDWCALSASALVLIVLAWLVSFVPHEKPPTNNAITAQNQSSYPQTGGISAWIDRNHDNIAAVSTFFIAAFTLTLFVATMSLRRSNDNTIREMRRIANEEFIALHPPHIRVKHVWLNSQIWNGEKIILKVVLVNVGKTAAQIGVVRIVTLVYDSGYELPIGTALPPEATYAPAQTPSILPSGITLDLPDQTDGRILTADENVAIRDGTKRLYCIGSIEYYDQAGRIKKTAYCRVLKPPIKPRSHLDIGRFVIHPDPDYEYED